MKKKTISYCDIESRAAYYQQLTESITLESLKVAVLGIGCPAVIPNTVKLSGFLSSP